MYWLRIFVFCSIVLCAYQSVLSSQEGPHVKDTTFRHPPSTEDYTPVCSDSVASERGLNLNYSYVNLSTTSSDKLHFELNKTTENEHRNEVCFEGLECFYLGKPWRSILRPVGAPMHPRDIKTSADFYSRENPNNPVFVYLYPLLNLEKTPFNPNRVTVIIVHGYAASGNEDWLRDLKDAYLKRRDANVFLLDWEVGAQLLSYLKVVANIRVVAKEVAILVKELINNYGARAENFHLIGHSLGAHISAYVGKEIPGIGHLTALDPAQPAFEGFEKKVRLHKSDAKFVEVIHTDARPFIPTLGFGMMKPYGDVDFYVNGGFEQPGCFLPTNITLKIVSLDDLEKLPMDLLFKFTCAHSRVLNYYIEALNDTNCVFWGRKIHLVNIIGAAANVVTQGLFSLVIYKVTQELCTKENCIPMGLETIDAPLRGSFVVMTTYSPPFCKIEKQALVSIPKKALKSLRTSFKNLLKAVK